MVASQRDNPCQTMRVFLGAELHGVNSFYGHWPPPTILKQTSISTTAHHRLPKLNILLANRGSHYSKAPCLKQMQNNLFHWSVLLELDVRERDGKTRMAKYSHFQVYCCCNSCIFILLPLEVVDFNHFQHITCQSQYVSWIRPVLQ